MLADCLAPFGTGASIGKVMSKGVYFMGLSIQFNPTQEQLCMKQFGINISALKQTWFKSSWPGEVIWAQWSWSTSAQFMTCWLIAPCHYLNQTTYFNQIFREKTFDIWGITWTRNDKDVWHYTALVHHTKLIFHWLSARLQQLHC